MGNGKLNMFLVFTQKEFYHIVRDRWTSIILLVLPVLMILLFGFGISTEIKNTKFAVWFSKADGLSKSIVENLNASEYFVLEEVVQRPQDIDQLFRRNEIGFALVFSEGFDEKALYRGDAQILFKADGTDPNTASSLTSYASGIVRQHLAERFPSQPNLRLETEVKLLYNPTMSGAYSTVPGVMGMVMMLICAMMTSVSIAREKELGSMEVVLVSSMPPLLIILAKMVPYLILSLINFATVLSLAVFVLEVPVNGSLLVLCLASVIFILVSLSLGLMVSTIVDTQLKALLFSVMGLMLPVVMLSGLMFPVENMPLLLQGLAQIIPAKWYISAARDVMIKGTNLVSIGKDLLILLIMFSLFLSFSLKNFKTRLE